jgi:hypothetical protein
MKRLVKITAIASLLMVSGLSTFAQYVNDAENDTIALGSQARYLVNLNITNANPLFNNSGIIWTFPTGYTAANFTQIDGTSALTLGADLAYDQNEIVMTALALTGGTPLTLSAQERSRPLVGVGCTAANTTTRDIVVVAMPTASYGADSGACSLPASLPLPVTLTGYGNYDIRFSVQAYDMTNAPVGAAVNVDLTSFYNARTSGSQSDARVPLSTASFAALGSGGYYVISMVNLQDRISKKTLNYAFNTVNVANANPDAADEYRYYVYPTPTTQPIQHIRNF